MKLPKFELKKYNSDPTNWRSFIESFEAAIDSNSQLSDIEKINFLMNYVEGQAESTIKGLKLHSDNYRTAKNMLEERFGDPQVLISTHMAKLLSLETVTNVNDVKKLRQLYDEIETQVRSLQCLGLDPRQYGSVLTPVLLTKIPDEFKLVISRQFGKSVWDISKVLEHFNLELEAREKVNFENSKSTEHLPTGAALVAHINKYDNHKKPDSFQHKSPDTTKTYQNNLCVFCKRNHYSTQCNIVTKPDIRKKILMEEKRCFKCMKFGHSALKCRSNISCYKCDGKHHTTICTFERKNKDQTLNYNNNKIDQAANSSKLTLVSVSKNNPVLLQTARANVSSTDKKNTKNSRLLFDTGSQLTYISPKARSELNLATVGKREIAIKTFGNVISKKTVDIVEFAVKSKDQSMNIYVKALVSDICHPIEEQKIDLAQEKYSHLHKLNLADSNPNNLPMIIDILIGADYYWDFIRNRMVRGPVAISSCLGYILSGGLGFGSESFSFFIKRSQHSYFES